MLINNCGGEDNIYDGGMVCTFHGVMLILQIYRYNRSSLIIENNYISGLSNNPGTHSIPHWGTPAFHPTPNKWRENILRT